MAEETTFNLTKPHQLVIENEQKINNHRHSLSGVVFEKADFEKAKEQVKKQSNRFYKEEQVSSFVDIKFFRMYGMGIYMFFNFTWSLSIMFLILSIVSIFPMVYNYMHSNSFQNTTNNLQLTITKLSIGAYYYAGQQGDENAMETSLRFKHINAITDIVCSFMFFVFYFYWQKRSKKIQGEILKRITLSSQKTIEVIEFPDCANKQIIEDFMSKFGKVAEVAEVKNYEEKIYLSKKIYDLQMQVLQQKTLLQKENGIKLQQQIIDKQKKIECLYSQLDTMEQSNKKQYIKFYVSFESFEEKTAALNRFIPYQKFCDCCVDVPEQLLINSQKIIIQDCFTEPAGIIWENVHCTWATRWLRLLIQFLIILVIIGGGFLFISFLNILVPSDNTSGVDTSEITASDIQQEQNQDIIRVWCINNISVYYNDETIAGICSTYWQMHVRGLLITISISLAVVVFKFIVKVIVIGLAKFQRYANHTQQSVTMMTNLMVTYISTTVLITFLMQANMFGISFKNAMLYFVSDEQIISNLTKLREYDDLTHQWYFDIGYQIWFNSLILAFVPHFILPIVSSLLQCIKQCTASQQIFQKNMVQKLRKPQFEIEDHYANILMIMVIGLFFGGPLPSIIFVSFIGLITRYVFFKIMFIKHSRVPKTYNQALNNRAMTIMKVSLVLKCIFGIWAFGATDIFAEEVSIFEINTDVMLFEQLGLLIQRVFVTWYYAIIVVFFILIFILRDTLVSFIMSLCNKSQSEKLEELQTKNLKANRMSIKVEEVSLNEQVNEQQMKQIEGQQKDLSIVSQRALTKSYRIQNNPDYEEILAIMHLTQSKKNY